MPLDSTAMKDDVNIKTEFSACEICVCRKETCAACNSHHPAYRLSDTTRLRIEHRLRADRLEKEHGISLSIDAKDEASFVPYNLLDLPDDLLSRIVYFVTVFRRQALEITYEDDERSHGEKFLSAADTVLAPTKACTRLYKLALKCITIDVGYFYFFTQDLAERLDNMTPTQMIDTAHPIIQRHIRRVGIFVQLGPEYDYFFDERLHDIAFNSANNFIANITSLLPKLMSVNVVFFVYSRLATGLPSDWDPDGDVQYESFSLRGPVEQLGPVRAKVKKDMLQIIETTRKLKGIVKTVSVSNQSYKSHEDRKIEVTKEWGRERSNENVCEEMLERKNARTEYIL